MTEQTTTLPATRDAERRRFALLASDVDPTRVGVTELQQYRLLRESQKDVKTDSSELKLKSFANVSALEAIQAAEEADTRKLVAGARLLASAQEQSSEKCTAAG